MKEIILSADGDKIVYLVPDGVADNLEKYCMEFCDDWIWNSQNAKHLRTQEGVCYTEEDFIEYLNNYIFPSQKSRFIKNLGSRIPFKYRKHPCFNF